MLAEAEPGYWLMRTWKQSGLFTTRIVLLPAAYQRAVEGGAGFIEVVENLDDDGVGVTSCEQRTAR